MKDTNIVLSFISPTRMTTALEISKKLKEIWFDKESLFCRSNWRWEYDIVYKDPFRKPIEWLPAYLTDELLRWLPEDVIISKDKWDYICWYKKQKLTRNKSLPDALAEMIIYLHSEWILPT